MDHGGFDALQALDRSRRKVWIGLVGSPAAAWLWADTIAASRAFEAGPVSPPPLASMALTAFLVWTALAR